MKTWFVVEYPSSESNEGKVLWDTENENWGTVRRLATELQKINPNRDYEVSDLPDLQKVFKRDTKN